MTLSQFSKPLNPHYFSSLPEINNPAIYVRAAGFQLAAFLPGSLLGVLNNPTVIHLTWIERTSFKYLS